MVYAPDAERLRSLFARSFKRGSHTPARRDHITHRLEPSFDPIPQTVTPNRERPSAVVSDRASAPATRADTQRAPDTWSRPRARYGLPGARPSDVFGPYARSAEAELSIDVEDDDESESRPSATSESEGSDSLIDRLSRALSGIETDLEKNSGDPSGDQRDARPVEDPSRAKNGPRVIALDEGLARDGSTNSLESDASR